MRLYLRLAITTLVVSGALTALVSTASARNLSVSAQAFRISWTSLEWTIGGVRVLCPTTLEGSFHTATFGKTAGALLGYVTRSIIRRPCTGGTMWFHSGETNEVLGGTFANTLPWFTAYSGFEGTLPALIRVRFTFPTLLAAARASVFGIPVLCEYITDNSHGNAIGTANRDTATGVLTTLDMSGTIRNNGGSEFCPDARLQNAAGDGVITRLGLTTRITLTLI